MTDKRKRADGNPELDHQDELPAEIRTTEPAEAGPQDDQTRSEADQIQAMAAEAADLRERLLRTMADMENLRKRTEREKAEASLYAATSFARDLLSVADSMDRALQSVPAEGREQL